MIIATGDLSEDGAGATYQRLAGILAKLTVPVYVTAGNHDDPATDVNTSAKCQHPTFSNLPKIANWGVYFF